MCRFNLSFTDTLVDDMRTHFDGEEDMKKWMETHFEELMREYVAQFKQPKVNGDLLLKQLQSLGDGPEGFLKLDTVLTPSQYSIEELREDAYFDKYGI